MTPEGLEYFIRCRGRHILGYQRQIPRPGNHGRAQTRIKDLLQRREEDLLNLAE